MGHCGYEFLCISGILWEILIHGGKVYFCIVRNINPWWKGILLHGRLCFFFSLKDKDEFFGCNAKRHNQGKKIQTQTTL